jgi:hypothetical protein
LLSFLNKSGIPASARSFAASGSRLHDICHAQIDVIQTADASAGAELSSTDDGGTAHLIEELTAHAPAAPAAARTLSQSSANQALARARTCYDHLAGRLGVAVSRTRGGRRGEKATAIPAPASPPPKAVGG